MGMREEISTKVASITGLATTLVEGTNLFIGSMPDSPDVCVAIDGYGGRAADLGFGTAGIQHDYPRVQIRCRGATDDESGPCDMLQAIYIALAKVQATTLSSTRYYMILPVQSGPFKLEKDGSRRNVFAVNFETDKTPS
jgi:hypothetical protein